MSTPAVERDVMEYDICIVGAGPSGLSCAIRLKQLKPDLNICILEKASAVGAHSLSGAVMEPGPLDALLPEWRQSPPGICVPECSAADSTCRAVSSGCSPASM